MNFEKEKLKEFITRCDESILWAEAELEQIFAYLKQTYLYNGGRVIEKNAKVDKKAENEFLMKTLIDGIQKVMNYYAQAIDVDIRTEKYYTETRDFEAPFEFLEPSTFVNKMDINSANVEDLIQLNGIGKVYAERIVEYREKHGFFEDIYDLLKVKGIGFSNIRKFWYAIKAVVPKERIIFISPLLLKFKEEPNLPHYFKLIKETGGTFTEISGSVDFKEFKEELIDEKEYKKIIINEFWKIAEYIKNNSYPSFGKYGSTKRSKIKERDERRKKVEKMEEDALSDGIRVAILDDTKYFNFMQKILKKAKKRIYIIMFLMHFEEGDKGSTKRLLDEIVSARGKGLNIKIILDRGEKGCDYGSNIINKNAFDFLTENDIPVLPDKGDVKTHTKIVLIDDEHIIIGSHNWTAGSFFRYDDKSVYLQSKDMSEKLTEYFNMLWSRYEKGQEW